MFKKHILDETAFLMSTKISSECLHLKSFLPQARGFLLFDVNQIQRKSEWVNIKLIFKKRKNIFVHLK